MHELSIAQSIIDAITAEALKHNSEHVKMISIDVGELMQIDTRVLRDNLKLLLENSPRLKTAHLRVQTKHALFSCRKCSARWNMSKARRELAKVSNDLLVIEPDSKEVPLHFLPYLYTSFVHCPSCGSSDIIVTKGEDIQLRKLIME